MNETVCTTLAHWVEKNPMVRQEEVDFLDTISREFPCQITQTGELQKPFAVDDYMFLLVLDKTFPKANERNEQPFHVYPVVPGKTTLQKLGNPGVQYCTETGVPYLSFAGEGLDGMYEDYLNGFHNEQLCKTLVKRTERWVSAVKSMPTTHKGHRRQPYQKYTNAPNPDCTKIVLSDRAHAQIYNESHARIETETGGLLLGHYIQGVWYVVEASDPGVGATFQVAYHEGDQEYTNHVCGVMSRLYHHPLVFLGMWHRHPGSLDRFSSTDDRTNSNYAQEVGAGCISAIINYDPDFRMTFYYAQLNRQNRVAYTQVPIEIGDDKFGDLDLMKLKTVPCARTERMHV